MVAFSEQKKGKIKWVKMGYCWMLFAKLRERNGRGSPYIIVTLRLWGGGARVARVEQAMNERWMRGNYERSAAMAEWSNDETEKWPNNINFTQGGKRDKYTYVNMHANVSTYVSQAYG